MDAVVALLDGNSWAPEALDRAFADASAPFVALPLKKTPGKKHLTVARARGPQLAKVAARLLKVPTACEDRDRVACALRLATTALGMLSKVSSLLSFKALDVERMHYTLLSRGVDWGQVRHASRPRLARA